MTDFYVHDKDRCEASDEVEDVEKPSEPEKKPLMISLFYFDNVMDE